MRLIKNYQSKLGYDLLLEDLDRSKKFLRQRLLITKIAKNLGYINGELSRKLDNGDIKSLRLDDFTPEQQKEIKFSAKSIKLTNDEKKSAEGDPEFEKLKNLLKDDIKFLYPFVYMYFVEKTEYDAIESMYNDIKDLKPFLPNLKKMPNVKRNFDNNFIDPRIPNDKEHRDNSEVLQDAIEDLKIQKYLRNLVSTLPSKLKSLFKTTSNENKKKLSELAFAFEKIKKGDELTDEIDHKGNYMTKKDRLWKNFFGEKVIDNYRTLPDGSRNPKYGKLVLRSRLKKFERQANPIESLIKSLENYLDVSLNEGYVVLIERINSANDKYGEENGVDIVFDQKGIVIVRVKSFPANVALNSHTAHCIADPNTPFRWSEYAGLYNNQYYIYNLNIPSTRDTSTIGVTIDPRGQYRDGGCQTKTNKYIYDFKKLLKDWEKEYEINVNLYNQLKPKSKEEIELIKKSENARRDILRYGISIEEIKDYIENYLVDINADQGKVLSNAVDEDDLEKVKTCLELGASPNMSPIPNQSPIFKANSFGVIKLLIQYGANANEINYLKIINNNDIQTLLLALDNGLDVDKISTDAFRIAAKGTFKNINDIGEPNMEMFNILIKYGAKLKTNTNRDIVLKHVGEYARINMLKHILNERGDSISQRDLESCYGWVRSARKINEENRQMVLEYLQTKIERDMSS